MNSKPTASAPVATPSPFQQGDPFSTIFWLLDQAFYRNAWIALLVFLALLSGGTDYAFAVRLAGRSSSGKSYLAELVRSFFPSSTVIGASRVSRAGIFSLPKFAGLVLDEFVADPEVLAVLRELISKGYCEQYLAEPNGETRPLKIDGPVAVVDVKLAGTKSDFQDANRAISVTMDDSPEQTRFVAKRVVRGHTTEGIIEARDFTQAAGAIQPIVDTIVAHRTVVTFANLDRLIPDRKDLPIELPRRVGQICNLASTIALWRQADRQRDHLGNIVGQDQDVELALRILENVAVLDDQEANTGEDLGFFRIAYQALKNESGMTLEGLVAKLNDEEFYSRNIALSPSVSSRAHKPLYPRGRNWTRRIVEEPMKNLRDSGLVDRTEGRQPYLWSLTPNGAAYGAAQSGGVFAILADTWRQRMAAEAISRLSPPVNGEPVNDKSFAERCL